MLKRNSQYLREEDAAVLHAVFECLPIEGVEYSPDAEEALLAYFNHFVQPHEMVQAIDCVPARIVARRTKLPYTAIAVLADHLVKWLQSCELCDGQRDVMVQGSTGVERMLPCPDCEGTGLDKDESFVFTDWTGLVTGSPV